MDGGFIVLWHKNWWFKTYMHSKNVTFAGIHVVGELAKQWVIWFQPALVNPHEALGL